MGSLKIYFHAKSMNSIEEIRNKILQNPNLRAKIEGTRVQRSGYYIKILKEIGNNYYVSDYIVLRTKKIPSLNSELEYFKYKEGREEIKEEQYPIIIKILFNPKKQILCLFTRVHLKDDISERFIQALDEVYNFFFSLEIYEYKKNHMQPLVDTLKIKNYELIEVWDHDNKLALKNPKNITETDKYLEFIKEKRGGNWTHLVVPFNHLNIKLHINNSSKNFMTFANDYEDDTHLIKAVDFLINKIMQVEDLSGPKQTMLKGFF
ncbi:MAG: hypothetical protein ACFFDN_31660 [Candidatus Hodarchaeota archaeon]